MTTTYMHKYMIVLVNATRIDWRVRLSSIVIPWFEIAQKTGRHDPIRDALVLYSFYDSLDLPIAGLWNSYLNSPKSFFASLFRFLLPLLANSHGIVC